MRSGTAAGVTARTAAAGAGGASPAWFVTDLLSISIESVRVYILFLVLHEILP